MKTNNKLVKLLKIIIRTIIIESTTKELMRKFMRATLAKATGNGPKSLFQGDKGYQLYPPLEKYFMPRDCHAVVTCICVWNMDTTFLFIKNPQSPKPYQPGFNFRTFRLLLGPSTQLSSPLLSRRNESHLLTYEALFYGKITPRSCRFLNFYPY